eukprot:Skav231852  [mRNA]  locus=scaffold2307:16794:18047:+ [translate_table: standard]
MPAFSVPNARAKLQLKNALSASSIDARLRRLQQVLDLNILENGEDSRYLWNLASRELQACKNKMRLPPEEEPPPTPEPSDVQGQNPPAEALGPNIDVGSRGQAAQVDGGFGWIRKANAQGDREARREISAATRQVVQMRSYQLGTTVLRLQHVDEMLKGTRLLSPSLPGWPQVLKGKEKTALSVERGPVLDVAVQKAKAGQHVVAVNAASAYHAGGGFLTGGRHALEEAMCVQSSLYDSLERGIGLAEAAKVQAPSWARPAQKKDGTPWVSHLPDDGVLLSPKVEVFRDGTNDGYSFKDSVTLLSGIVSVAMPNCNEKMSDSPVDSNPDAEGYKTQLTKKWLAVLTAASACEEATTLVVPDAGCGVFYNPPEQVGESFGKALAEFSGRFKQVFIAFPGGKAGEAFAAAATAAFSSVS